MKYLFPKITVEVRPEGDIERFTVVHHDPVVAIVAYNDDYVFLVEQYRPAVGKRCLELPAGFIDKFEVPHEAAMRELREELGIVANHWTDHGSFFSSPGFTTEKVHLFFARELYFGPADPDENEDIVLVDYPLDDIESAIAEADSAKTKVGLLQLKMMHLS